MISCKFGDRPWCSLWLMVVPVLAGCTGSISVRYPDLSGPVSVEYVSDTERAALEALMTDGSMSSGELNCVLGRVGASKSLSVSDALQLLSQEVDGGREQAMGLLLDASLACATEGATLRDFASDLFRSDPREEWDAETRGRMTVEVSECVTDVVFEVYDPDDAATFLRGLSPNVTDPGLQRTYVQYRCGYFTREEWVNGLIKEGATPGEAACFVEQIVDQERKLSLEEYRAAEEGCRGVSG